MPKKSNQKRSDGRIAVQVYLGRVDGIRKYKTVYGKTQKEADKKATELKNQINKGFDLFQANTFGAWMESWLNSKKARLPEAQFKDTQARCKYFDELKDIKLSAMRPLHFQEIIDNIAQKNPHTGKPSSQRLLAELKSIAVQIINLAVENRVTDYNPAQYIKIHCVAVPNERRALSKEEQWRVANTTHRAQTAAMIMMYAGLRRGELTVLTWSDVDLNKKSISVTKSYDFKNGRTKTPKTKSGNRVVFMPDVLCDYLETVPKNNILVFPSANGKMMTSTAWKRLWESYMLEMDIQYGTPIKNRSKYAPVKRTFTIQPFTPHCLRHTYCTLLYESGVDVLVAKEQMGHADVQTTLSIYTHLSNEHQRKDIEKFNQMLKEDEGFKKTAEI